jgi:molybdate transport system regulatory protein
MFAELVNLKIALPGLGPGTHEQSQHAGCGPRKAWVAGPSPAKVFLKLLEAILSQPNLRDRTGGLGTGPLPRRAKMRLPCDSIAMARLKVTIVFDSGARIGPGKAMLLESIRATGSISAAAREMRMSYKRAWLLLDSMNQAFTRPVVAAAPGGAGGGGAVLTAFGAEVLERYRRILERATATATDDLTALAHCGRPDTRPKV